MWHFPKSIFWVLLSIFVAASVGCGDVREVSGVYTERIDTLSDDDRRYALRMTIFEYDSFVGGWIEYYALGEINRADTPYVRADYCTYFGPFRRVNGVTVIHAQSPEPDASVLLRMEADGRRVQHATLVRDGGILHEDARVGELIFEKQNDVPAEACPTNATPLDIAHGPERLQFVSREGRRRVGAL